MHILLGWASEDAQPVSYTSARIAAISSAHSVAKNAIIRSRKFMVPPPLDKQIF